MFESVFERADRETIDARLASEARMDPDYWLVDIEARDGRIDLPLVQDEPKPDTNLFRF